MKNAVTFGISIVFLILLMTGCNTSSETERVPPSQQTWTMSIITPLSSVSTGKGTHIAHFAVHTLDQNGNPRSNLPIKVALINAAARECYFEGNYGELRTTNPLSFADPNVNFTTQKIKLNDTLIVLPTAPRQDSSYLGNWKITNIGNVLEFAHDLAYNVETTDLLHYVVGNEKCLLNDIKVAHVQYPDNNSSTDTSEDKGLSYFDVVYDDALGMPGNNMVYIGVHVDKIRFGTGALIYLPLVDSNVTQ